MRSLVFTIAALTLAGCALPNKLVQSASFASSPLVIYQSADTIGVEYTDDGLMRLSNRQEALAMVGQHCGGQYRVVGGDSEGRIEAECVRSVPESLSRPSKS
jgi:hypothetical protein